MTLVGTPDFQEQAQWSAVAWDLNWSPTWGGGNVFSSIIPCAAWLGEQFLVANTGARDIQMTVTWFFDAAGTLPVGSKIITISVAIQSARFFLVHKGPYFQVELTANGTGCAATVQAMGSNRPQPPWQNPNATNILNVQNIVVGANASTTQVATGIYEGMATLWGFTQSTSFTLGVLIRYYSGGQDYFLELSNQDCTPRGDFRTQLFVPPHTLVFVFNNTTAGAVSLYLSLTADFSR